MIEVVEGVVKWLRLYQTMRNEKSYFGDLGGSNCKRPGSCFSWTCLRKEERRGSLI